MGCDVYANSDEIACKAGDGKVIAAFPDVCLSPPSPPAGPIPVPYPDTSFSKDMQNGSKTVKIKGQEVMLKDKSFYKTAPLGDEAATQGLGANVITHVITGKTYFVMWSLDVKIEGENVDRHVDLTTSNHASIPPGVPKPGPNCSSQDLGAWEDSEGVCACCDQALHACQTGAPVTDERGYYGLDERVPSNPSMPDLMGVPAGSTAAVTRAIESRNMETLNGWQERCDDLQKRRDALDARKKAVFDARRSGCESLPQYPCNVYRIATPAQTESCEIEWRGASAAWKARQTPPIPAGEKVNHRVPKSASGCPTGDGNLVADSQLKGKGPGDCVEIDDRITKAQSSSVDGRAKGHF